MTHPERQLSEGEVRALVDQLLAAYDYLGRDIDDSGDIQAALISDKSDVVVDTTGEQEKIIRELKSLYMQYGHLLTQDQKNRINEFS